MGKRLTGVDGMADNNSDMEDETRHKPLRGSKLEQMWLDGVEGRLHPAEVKLLEACRRGEECVVGEIREGAVVRPHRATGANKIRAGFLRFLIVGGCEAAPVHARGVRLLGAYVICDEGAEGICELDLEAVNIPNEFELFRCIINGRVNLRGATGWSMSFDGTHMEGVAGDRLKAKGGVFLRNGFRASSDVRLSGAKLGGDLDCTGGRFEGAGYSLLCDGLETKGDVFLRNEFHASGEVRLLGAKLGGDLSCTRGRFAGTGYSLLCDGLETKGGVFLRDGFHASGAVRLKGAKLGGALSCIGGRFEGTENSLSCDRLGTKGSVFLQDGFHAGGEVRLIGARIGGQLVCNGGKFDGEFSCDEAKIGSSVYLDDRFIAKGRVSFSNARIGGNISCNGGSFLDKDNAFFANRAVIEGDVEFNNVISVGTISLTGSNIAGNLSFVGISIEGEPCVKLRGTCIDGMFTWREIKYTKGELDLASASCKTINMDKNSWFRKQQHYLAPGEDRANNSEGNNRKRKRHEISRATRLDNFTYKGFSSLPLGTNASFWCRWLEQQPDDHLEQKFRPKPWSQLADVLDSMGHEAEAKALRIRREDLATRFMMHHDPETSKAKWLSWVRLRLIWRRIWGVTVDYGYQPMKALVYLMLVIFIGGAVYWWAAHQGIMAPVNPLIFQEVRLAPDANPGTIDRICARNWVYFEGNTCSSQIPSEYSEFMALIYSADVALPIINLRQQEDWSPRVVDHDGNFIWSGHFVRLWEWLVTVLGWILSLMFVSAVGRFIRR